MTAYGRVAAFKEHNFCFVLRAESPQSSPLPTAPALHLEFRRECVLSVRSHRARRRILFWGGSNLDVYTR